MHFWLWTFAVVWGIPIVWFGAYVLYKEVVAWKKKT